MFRRMLAAAFAASLLLTASAFAQLSPGEFTMVALPDTQFYAKSYPQIFSSQTEWIASHKQQMNIQLVVGLGDIVDSGGQTYQWQNADAAYRVLDGVVPYIVPMGNHDYNASNPSGRTAASTNFNAYFGPQRYAGQSSYRGNYPKGSNESFYSVFTLGGKQYVLLVVEPFPRDGALSWAASVVKNNTDKDIIVVTHAYTYADSTRMDKCDSNNAASFGVGQDNDGEQIWEKFASKYANITMVLSGHVVQGDGTGRRTDFGVNGNIVNQMLSDYQSWPYGGDGYLRLITVKPALNQVVVRTYSPWLNQWLTDGHNQFTVPYKNVGGTVSTTVAGKVKDVETCGGVAGAVVSNGKSSATTDSYGYYKLTATAPSSDPLTVTKSGLRAAPQQISFVSGQTTGQKVMMSSYGVLRGKVVVNGVAVSGATVKVSGGALRTSRILKSASDGTFSTGATAIGNYKVTVSASGYGSATYSTSVSTGTTSYLSAVLP